MWTEQINHDPAHTFMNTGSIITGRPSMGSWVLYGLGAETEDLPGFVVLVSPGNGGQMQPIAARQWSAGILPSKFQGVKFNSIGDPVLYIANPRGVEPRHAGRFDRRHQRTEPTCATSIAARSGNCKRASPSTRWRSRCRRAFPDWWT